MRKFVLAIGSLIVHKLRWKAMLGYIGRACACVGPRIRTRMHPVYAWEVFVTVATPVTPVESIPLSPPPSPS